MGLGLEPRQFASRVLAGEDGGAEKKNVCVNKGKITNLLDSEGKMLGNAQENQETPG